jgi:L-asparagine transporter-like permease
MTEEEYKNCKVIENEIFCEDDDGNMKKIGNKSWIPEIQNIQLGEGNIQQTTRTVGFSITGWHVFLFILGAIIYQDKITVDFGHPVWNFLMAGLFVIGFSYLMWVVFLGNIIWGIGWFSQQAQWYQNALDLTRLGETTVLTDILFWVSRWFGYAIHIIIIIAIVALIIVGLVWIMRNIDRQDRKKMESEEMESEEMESEEKSKKKKESKE